MKYFTTLQTKPVVRSVAQQPNWLAKKAICAANVGWLAGPKPVGAQSALVWAWQLAGNWLVRVVCGASTQPTGWQLAGLELRRNQLAGNWLATQTLQSKHWGGQWF